MIPIKSLLLVLPFALLLGLPAGAALPRTAIEDYQKKSLEYVELLVTKVDKKAVKKNGNHSFDLTVQAKVVGVHRSKAGLRPGDEITITYSLPNMKKSPAAGDWAGEVKEGTPYQAYLRVEDAEKKHYRPAAYSGTFAKSKPKAG